ncbi:hypothetical protein J25TS5_20090 [Paenibacillus faecis]|nr:hypothetical protein J25TS5_20090 [Paenibacillus faecis]
MLQLYRRFPVSILIDISDDSKSEAIELSTSNKSEAYVRVRLLNVKNTEYFLWHYYI